MVQKCHQLIFETISVWYKTDSISTSNNNSWAEQQTSYETQIPKLMPPGVPIHFFDDSFVVTAVDPDFVSPEPDGDDTSNNNIITVCIVEGVGEHVIKCDVRKEETGEAYRMWVSLK